MEAILHIEPILRKIDPPLNIGKKVTVSYGDPINDRADCDEECFIPSVTSVVGSPIESPDVGNTRDSISFYKTVEYSPSSSRKYPHVFSETIHYVADKFLIPVQTRMINGEYGGWSFSHMPSLNYIRGKLGVISPNPSGYREDIIENLLNKDEFLSGRRRHPVRDWVEEELIYELNKKTFIDSVLKADEVKDVAEGFLSCVKGTSHEFGIEEARRVHNSIVLENKDIPGHLLSQDVVARSIGDIRRSYVHTSIDFQVAPRIPKDNLPNIVRNPLNFYGCFATMKYLPVTDCNIDVVVGGYGEVLQLYDNVVVNRYASLNQCTFSHFQKKELLSHILRNQFLDEVVKTFIYHHPAMTHALYEELVSAPVKLKFIITNGYEFLVLLFRYNSGANDDPICGVYFDDALESLAPLSLVENYFS